MNARRAVIRWAWRLFRREWRQQAVVLALLSVAVGAAIVSASIAYNVAAVPGDAEFGTAGHAVRFEPPDDPRALQADLAFAERQFGTIDVIGRRQVPLRGSTETVELRAQDPAGAFGAPMLALRDGRYPRAKGELAVTDGLADALTLDVGSSFVFDGARRTVVGLVENPSDLGADFALVAPTHADPPDSVTLLVAGDDDRVMSFRAPSGAPTTRMVRADDEDVAAATGVLGTATMGMLLIALVAAASFVVVAQRRLRQLGMLAAIGATQRQLRLVTLANGAVIGTVAAAIGGAGGLLVWVAAVPLTEPAVGHRIDPLNVPAWLIGAAMLLAVATATAAAWWPARTVARVPVTEALSGRPPKPRRGHRSLSLAGIVIAVALVCLGLADRTSQLLLGVGGVAAVAGVLLLCPSAIRAANAPAGRFPVAVRLALRDLARYHARSGAALAAITVTLGISAATVIAASAAEQAPREGNLSDRQLLVRTGTVVETEGDNVGGPFVPERTSVELGRLARQVDRIAAPLEDPEVIPLDVALDPAAELDPLADGRPAVTLAEFVTGERPGWRDVTLLYVAEPELLARAMPELGSVRPGTEIVTVESDELRLSGLSTAPEALTAVERVAPTYTSLPGSFITREALRRRGWISARAGWLVEAGAPLTSAQLAAARDVAADAGLTVESRDLQEDLAARRSEATIAGALLALAVLAMTMGLIRGEAAGDLRTLTAAGATASARRTLTAATAAVLATLGAVLGTLGAYVALGAGYLDPDSLTPVPVGHLLVIGLGVPAVAALGGWLFAGGEPAGLARQPIE